MQILENIKLRKLEFNILDDRYHVTLDEEKRRMFVLDTARAFSIMIEFPTEVDENLKITVPDRLRNYLVKVIEKGVDK